MADKKRTLVVRYSMEDEDKLIKAYESMGAAGDKFIRQIKRANEEASSSMKALDTAVDAGKEKFKSLSNELPVTARVLGSFGPAGIAAAAGIAIAVQSLREFSKYQEAVVKFEATLRAGGNSSKELVENIKEYAEQIERTTLFSAEAALDAGAKLATFKNISKDSFEEVISLSADMAAVFGGDLSSASFSLGKALEDPIKGMTLLHRQGIILSAQQKQQITDFMASGETAKAQSVILEVLRGKVGGVAVELGGTLHGAWKHLGDAIADTSKQMGGAINDMTLIDRLIQSIADGINRNNAIASGGLDKYIEQQQRIRDATQKTAEAQAKARAEAERQQEYTDKVARLNAAGGNYVGISLPNNVEASLAIVEQLNQEHRLLTMTKEDREVELALRTLINKAAEEGHALAENDPQIEMLREKIRLNLQLSEVQQGAVKEYIDGLNHERQLASLSNRERAVAQAMDKAEAAAKLEKRELSAAEEDQIRSLAAANYDLQRAQKDQVGEYIKSLDQELQLLGLSNRERAVQEALINATNKAKQAERRLTDEEIAQIKQKAGAIFDQKDATKKVAEAAKEDAEIFKQFARDGYNAITNSVESAFTGSLNGLEDYIDQFKKLFARFLANLATMALAEPVIIPVIESIGSGAGLSQSSIAAITKQFGGGSSSGSSLSSIGNLSGISDLLGLKGTGSGIIDSINSFGASQLGFAQVSPDFVGPLLPGTQVGQTFSGFLGSTGMGAGIGGFAASMLGLGSNNAWVNSGASLAGAALGNLLLPGIGGVIGGFGGTALAGLFGGGTPHPAATVGVTDVSSTGTFDEYALQFKHLSKEEAQKTADTVQTLFTSLAKFTGLDLSVLNQVAEGAYAFAAGVDNGKGFLTFGTDGKSSFDSGLTQTKYGAAITFNPQDEADIQRALGEFAKLTVDRIDALGGEVSDSLLSSLEKIKTEGRKADDVLQDIAFVLNFDKLGDVPETLSEVEQKLKTNAALFDVAANTAERLGLSIEKVNAAEQKQIERMLGDELKQVNQGIVGLVDAAAAAQQAEQDRYEAQVKDLTALGASQAQLQQAQLLHNLNLARIMQQNNKLQQQGLQLEKDRITAANETANRYSSVSGSLTGFLASLKFGNFTDLAPQDKLDAMRAQLTKDFAAANDNVAAKEELAALLPNFLELSNTINGGNTKYAADRKFAADIAASTKTIADQQLEVQKQIAALSQEQVAAIEGGFTSLKQATLITQQVAALNATPPSANYKGGGFSSDNLNEVYVKNSDSLRKAGLLDTVESMIKAYTYGLYGGGGRRSAFFETNPDIEAAARETLRNMGIPGFKDGGLITGGVPGVDSVPILAMQNERILSVPQSTMFESIYNMSKRAVNDNSVAAEIRALRGDVQQLIKVLHAHGITNIDGLRSVAKKVEELSSAPRLKSITGK